MAKSTDPYSASGEPPGSPRAPVPPRPESPAVPPFSITGRQEYPSGLLGVQGTTTDAAALVRHFGRVQPGHLLVKPPAQGGPPSQAFLDSTAHAPRLWDWLPEAAAKETSPRLLPADGQFDVNSVWGQDRLVCLFAEAPADKLLSQLQARDGGDPDLPHSRVLVLAQPSTARQFLREATPEFAQSTLAGAEGILVEDQEPEQWELFCTPKLAAAPAMDFRSA